MARVKRGPGTTIPRESDEQDEQGGGSFKLLASQHQQADPDWKPTEAQLETAKKTGVEPKPATKTYVAGEVVESDIDLVARFGANKFMRITPRARRVSGPATVVETRTRPPTLAAGKEPESDEDLLAQHETGDEPDVGEGDEEETNAPEVVDYDAMTVPELKQYAHDNDVDLKGATHKADIVKALKRRRK